MAETRRLTVIKRVELSNGTGRNGPWTLYKVEAITEEGEPVEAELKTFDDVPVGEARTYTVERNELHEGFLLKLPSSGARLGPKVDELRERVEAVEESNRGLHDRLEAVERQLAESTPTSAPAPASPPADDDPPPF